jgi:2-methylcitrate dehydratase PrpD
MLRERLRVERPLSRVAETYMKRWPVGSLAQSAIQAALQAREKVGDLKTATLHLERALTYVKGGRLLPHYQA